MESRLVFYVDKTIVNIFHSDFYKYNSIVKNCILRSLTFYHLCRCARFPVLFCFALSYIRVQRLLLHLNGTTFLPCPALIQYSSILFNNVWLSLQGKKKKESKKKSIYIKLKMYQRNACTYTTVKCHLRPLPWIFLWNTQLSFILSILTFLIF